MDRWIAYALSVILLIAGVLHFLAPDLFLVAMPPYIPFHLEIIYLTGLVEIILSLCLVIKKTRRYAGFVSSMYFFLILPAHIHVSINEIPMFGISSPLILWGRTLFQSFFIYCGYRVGRYSNLDNT